MLLPHLPAAADASSTGSAATVFAILASAVIVLGGLAALVRAIWKTANTLRDNTAATRQLTGRMDGLAGRIEGLAERIEGLAGSTGSRIDSLAERVGKLEKALTGYGTGKEHSA